MNAKAIVDTLLEGDPDEIIPKKEMLRNDPADDIKAIVHELQNQAAMTLGYSRAGGIVKLLIRLHEWATEEQLENWLHSYLDELGYALDRSAITVSNLGHEYQGCVWKVMFPLDGQPVPYTKLV